LGFGAPCDSLTPRISLDTLREAVVFILFLSLEKLDKLTYCLVFSLSGSNFQNLPVPGHPSELSATCVHIHSEEAGQTWVRTGQIWDLSTGDGPDSSPHMTAWRGI
jgi:hypothetical protein